MTNKTSTGEINLGQKEGCISAFRKAAGVGRIIGETIEELVSGGAIHKGNLQRVMDLQPRLEIATSQYVRELITEWVENSEGCTRPISEECALILEPTDGKRTIATAHSVFGYISDNCRRLGKGLPGLPTIETRCAVHEGNHKGSIGKIFGGLGSDLNALCFQEAQVVQFVEKYPDWIPIGYFCTFLLYKVGNELRLACVNRHKGAKGEHFGVNAVHFREFSGIHRDEDHYRVVVPIPVLES